MPNLGRSSLAIEMTLNRNVDELAHHADSLADNARICTRLHRADARDEAAITGLDQCQARLDLLTRQLAYLPGASVEVAEVEEIRSVLLCVCRNCKAARGDVRGADEHAHVNTERIARRVYRLRRMNEALSAGATIDQAEEMAS